MALRSPAVDPVDVVLVGAHGHGRSHLRNVRRLAEASEVRLAGVCDPRPASDDPALTGEFGDLLTGIPWLADLDQLLAAVEPAVTIVCTPIHTHADLALAALAAGSHVLLEKPPAPTRAEFQRLDTGVRASGLGCQVGFQSLGSAAVGAVRGMLAGGELGKVTGIGATGTWQRDAAYFGRSAWAGRRRLGDVDVVDGALTNPFAHAVITALALDGSLDSGALERIEVELYRANAIEADDTSCLRLRTARGTPIVVAVTLCAERVRPPVVTVHGTRGEISLAYKEGEVRVRVGGRERVESYPADDLLADLAEHVRDPRHPLLVPLSATGAFMDVVEAVRTAPGPRTVPAREVGENSARRQEIPGIDALIARAAGELKLFSELDPAWR